MLKKVILNNFRCYKTHEIDFKELSVIVGKNNAGKSTLIEGLRLIALVSERYENLQYHPVPDWLDIPLNNVGVAPSLRGMEISLFNLLYFYEGEYASIKAIFDSNYRIELYINKNGDLHAVIFNDKGKVIKTQTQAYEIDLPLINILPQIRPLQIDERLLDKSYVASNISTNLSSLHFRNQLQYSKKENFQKLIELSEETWKGLRIREFISGNRLTDQKPKLLVEEETFTTEIGYTGHGLQMWLQTMWFLARCSESSTVILDEPDVYLHSDLQRKLIRFLIGRFDQVIISTHSIEIISEIRPENILVIDRSKLKSVFLTDFPAVQNIIERIGSMQNIHLTKLWTAKKLLIVEGEDVEILKRIQSILFDSKNYPLDSIPNYDIGGWGGWNYVVGSKLLLRNAGEEKIIIYSIFDSDYHVEEDIRTRTEDAKNRGIEIHIWQKKELENYLLIPTLIYRIIKMEGVNASALTLNKVILKIDKIAQNLKDDLMDSLSNSFRDYNKERNILKGNKYAREKVRKYEKDGDLLAHVSGKDALGKLSEWTQQSYKLSLSKNKLAALINKTEIPMEMKDVLIKIEKCQPL